MASLPGSSRWQCSLAAVAGCPIHSIRTIGLRPAAEGLHCARDPQREPRVVAGITRTVDAIVSSVLRRLFARATPGQAPDPDEGNGASRRGTVSGHQRAGARHGTLRADHAGTVASISEPTL